MNIIKKILNNLTPRSGSTLIEKFELKHQGIDSYVFSMELREKNDTGRQFLLMNFSIPDAFHDVQVTMEEFEDIRKGIDSLSSKIKL